MSEKKLLLASASPRRRELMRLITENFECASADVDETLPRGISPKSAVLLLSSKKARALEEPGRLVVGADTVVALGRRIMGKPRDNDDAFEMLRALSGRRHRVLTGVTLLRDGRERSFAAETYVYFRTLSDAEIRRYIATGECADKAGAYGIQGRGALLVEKIHGDFFNVVGLPVSLLAKELETFG